MAGVAADATVGEAAEERVRERLAALAREGWTVYNNVFPDDRGGDVDHVVIAPSGRVFAIETKAASRASARALAQAVRNRQRIAALTDVRGHDCRAVLCLVGPDARSAREVRAAAGGVLVVAVRDLARALRAAA